MTVTLAELGSGAAGRIVGFGQGKGLRKKFTTRGIRIGSTVRVVARQPRGPIVIESGGFQLTVGRGMARKVMVDVPD